MADKKYLDNEGLQHYDEQLKDYIDDVFNEALHNGDMLILNAGTSTVNINKE